MIFTKETNQSFYLVQESKSNRKYYQDYNNHVGHFLHSTYIVTMFFNLTSLRVSQMFFDVQHILRSDGVNGVAWGIFIPPCL